MIQQQIQQENELKAVAKEVNRNFYHFILFVIQSNVLHTNSKTFAKIVAYKTNRVFITNVNSFFKYTVETTAANKNQEHAIKNFLGIN